MVFPELLARVLSGYTFEDLGAAWVLVDKACDGSSVQFYRAQLRKEDEKHPHDSETEGKLRDSSGEKETAKVGIGGGREEGNALRKEEEKKEKRYVLVTSYTFSSTMMYMPFSASLCSATSATVNCFDMFAVVLLMVCER